ncbi:SH3 and multiple ankyrin repeat domains protein 1 [Crotalus adamanteus]|uniref:SH3 and multiple ankyrin repeat domains protein 1 n=1 Tax=Crotalus adamanteus TaxID=8729 RepID=A0AAW1B0S8_CROAD
MELSSLLPGYLTRPSEDYEPGMGTDKKQTVYQMALNKLDEILAAAQQTISMGDGCRSGGLPSLGKTRGTAKNYLSSEPSFEQHHLGQASYERPSYLPTSHPPGMMLRQKFIAPPPAVQRSPACCCRPMFAASIWHVVLTGSSDGLQLSSRRDPSEAVALGPSGYWTLVGYPCLAAVLSPLGLPEIGGTTPPPPADVAGPSPATGLCALLPEGCAQPTGPMPVGHDAGPTGPVESIPEIAGPAAKASPCWGSRKRGLLSRNCEVSARPEPHPLRSSVHPPVVAAPCLLPPFGMGAVGRPPKPRGKPRLQKRTKRHPTLLAVPCLPAGRRDARQQPRRLLQRLGGGAAEEKPYLAPPVMKFSRSLSVPGSEDIPPPPTTSPPDPPYSSISSSASAQVTPSARSTFSPSTEAKLYSAFLHQEPPYEPPPHVRDKMSLYHQGSDQGAEGSTAHGWTPDLQYYNLHPWATRTAKYAPTKPICHKGPLVKQTKVEDEQHQQQSTPSSQVQASSSPSQSSAPSEKSSIPIPTIIIKAPSTSSSGRSSQGSSMEAETQPEPVVPVPSLQLHNCMDFTSQFGAALVGAAQRDREWYSEARHKSALFLSTEQPDDESQQMPHLRLHHSKSIDEESREEKRSHPSSPQFREAPKTPESPSSSILHLWETSEQQPLNQQPTSPQKEQENPQHQPPEQQPLPTSVRVTPWKKQPEGEKLELHVHFVENCRPAEEKESSHESGKVELAAPPMEQVAEENGLPLFVLPPPVPSIDVADEFVFTEPLPPPLEFSNSFDKPESPPKAANELPPAVATPAARPATLDSTASSLTSYDSEVATLTQAGTAETKESLHVNFSSVVSAIAIPSAEALEAVTDSGIEVDSRCNSDHHLETISSVSMLSSMSGEGTELVDTYITYLDGQAFGGSSSSGGVGGGSIDKSPLQTKLCSRTFPGHLPVATITSSTISVSACTKNMFALTPAPPYHQQPAAIELGKELPQKSPLPWEEPKALPMSTVKASIISELSTKLQQMGGVSWSRTPDAMSPFGSERPSSLQRQRY